MNIRFKAWFPFLLAPVPILDMAARHPGQFALDDLAVILLVLLAGCGLVFALTFGLSGRRRSWRAAAFATMMAVVWFYGYARPAKVINRHLGTSHWMLVLLGLLLTAALGYWLLRRRSWFDLLAKFLGITGVLLVAQLGLRIVLGQLRLKGELRHSALITRLAAPIPTRAGFHSSAPQRDVYVILLDEYANSAVTRERFGTDNREFVDSLRRLAFVVPQLVRSNYMHTTLSLPSLLNAAHLTELTREVGGATADPVIPNYLTEHNRSAAFLKRQGYQFEFFPSQWWLSTRHNHEADVEYHAWPTLTDRELSHSELRRKVRQISLLDDLQNDLGDDLDFVVRTLAGVRQVPHRQLTAPVFVFAHIMKPHHPFMFDEHCHARPHYPAHRGAGQRGYATQIRCLNAMVLQLVDTLLLTSRVPPIILLQGDHGTKTLGAPTARSATAIRPAAARERFGAFGAYYLPGGGSAQWGDTVTVVNVLGNVLRYYFGADLPPEPDNLYMSVSRKLYAFRQADPLWLAADGSP
jgi:hypothetical protein